MSTFVYVTAVCVTLSPCLNKLKNYIQNPSTTPSLVVFGEPSSKPQQPNKIAPSPVTRSPLTTTPFGGGNKPASSFMEEDEEDDEELSANSSFGKSSITTTTSSSYGGSAARQSTSMSTTTSSSVRERLERWKASTMQADTSASPTTAQSTMLTVMSCALPTVLGALILPNCDLNLIVE
uniref:Uncharacterized protein n=1 Tax=Ditylenchus dipsaci TaxID=166011 RepID=A0A915DTE1_9BILA